MLARSDISADPANANPANADPANDRTEETFLVLESVQKQMQLGSFLLDSGKFTIGSSPDCLLTLNAPGVRPHHCLILTNGKRTVLKAWDSRTWLNEGPVQEARLRSGDRLLVGPIEFSVRNASPSELSKACERPDTDGHKTIFDKLDGLSDAIHKSVEADVLPASTGLLSRRQSRLESRKPELVRKQSESDQHLQALKIETESARQELAEAKRRQNDEFENRQKALARREDELSGQHLEFDGARVELDCEWESLKAEKIAIAEKNRRLEKHLGQLGDAEQKLEEEIDFIRKEQDSLRDDRQSLDKTRNKIELDQ